MKICPRCGKSYTDEQLNFCLDDGSVLEQASSSSTMPETVLLNQPRTTAQQQQIPSQQYAPQQQVAQPAWNTAPQQYSMQPKKSSKMWVWVLLILGVLVVFCGGGAAGLIYLASQAEVANSSTNNSKKTSPTPTPGKNGLANTFSNSSTPTTTTDRASLESVDLNDWVQKSSPFGITSYTDGEFFMAAKQKGYYYVLAAPASKAKTEGANTKVTLRNIDNADSRLGYGLVFHSNPTPLQQGYAFLIDTRLKKYRVVHHSPQKEDAVVAWTKSDAILSGSAENTLEVRDLSDKVELYINGTMVNSIKNVYGYSGGVAGLYSGDGVNIAFKNLEVRR